MDVVTTAFAILSGLLTLAVGMFSLAAIWFDDLP